MIGKILVVGVLVLLVVSAIYISNGGIKKDIDSEGEFKIDTGFTPEQTWKIINGEDVGEVLNLMEINR